MNHIESLTPEQILELVHSVFPDADIVSSQLFAGEHTNLNYELRLTNLMTAVALKVYLDAANTHIPRKETQLLRLLTSETGVPVPRVLHFDDTGDLIPNPWALHTRLPGQPLSEAIDSLDDWELESIGYEMGRYLGRIHQIPLDEFGELYVTDPQNHATEKGYVVAKVAQWVEECEEGTLLPVEVADALRQIFAQSKLLSRRQACLIHGDYRMENIIVERGTTGYHVTGFLEFDQAQGGSPELDMSQLFIWSLEGSPTLQKGFLDGYTEFGELGAQFWERLRLYQVFTCLGRIPLAHQREQFRLEEGYRTRILAYLDDQVAD